MIFCNNNCAYQSDGYCTLNRALPFASNSNALLSDCMYFTPAGSESSGDSPAQLPDTPDSNKLDA